VTASSNSNGLQLVNRILASRKTGMVVLKYTLVIAVAAIGLTSLRASALSLLPPLTYRKDFIQEYLLARAILEGVDPYTPLPELASQFMGPLPHAILPHPTPHPPPVAIISLPLGLLTYEQAAVAWFLFEIGCLIASVYLLLRWLGRRPRLAFTLFIALLVLGWNPVWEELATGQLMILLLALLLGSWHAFRSGNAIRGGILLGCVVALKLVAWPIVIFLALRRDWRAVGAAIGTAIAANLAAVLLMGFDRVVYYYLHVGASISSLYRAYELNFSMWTIGWRVFEGTGAEVLYGVEAPPLVSAPALAGCVALVMPLILLSVGLLMAMRARSFDASFGILVCASILVNPITWMHYLVLASIPIVIAGRYLFDLHFPKKESYIAISIGLLLFLSHRQLRPFELLLAGQELAVDKFSTVPFAVSLLTLIPTVAVLGLLWLVWHLERIRSTEPARAEQLEPQE